MHPIFIFWIFLFSCTFPLSLIGTVCLERFICRIVTDGRGALSWVRYRSQWPRQQRHVWVTVHMSIVLGAMAALTLVSVLAVKVWPLNRFWEHLWIHSVWSGSCEETIRPGAGPRSRRSPSRLLVAGGTSMPPPSLSLYSYSRFECFCTHSSCYRVSENQASALFVSLALSA